MKKLICFTLVILSMPAMAATNNPTWLIYSVLALVIFVLLVSFMMFHGKLAKDKDWSIAKALSEEIEITNIQDGKPVYINGEIQNITKLCASSSRLIGLFGTLVILSLYIGFGILAILEFAHSGTMPEGIGDAIKFLLGGLTLFAPYAVNKFSGIFSSLSNPK